MTTTITKKVIITILIAAATTTASTIVESVRGPKVTACVFFLFSIQGKFSVIPSVFVTAAHYRAGLKRDAASVWIEDVTQSSFKVCLRELQNYAGSHDDVYIVSVYTFLYSPSTRN